MELIPPIGMTPFGQLEPGDLFLHMSGPDKFYALKTAQPPKGPNTTMVMLGPSFFEDCNESFLLPWETAMVLSFGKNFSILLPTEADAWSWSAENRRKPVCLAVAGENIYVCANGGPSPTRYFPCFVDVKTGAIVEQNLPGTSIYTNSWEIAVLGNNHPPRTILKFPLPELKQRPGPSR